MSHSLQDFMVDLDIELMNGLLDSVFHNLQGKIEEQIQETHQHFNKNQQNQKESQENTLAGLSQQQIETTIQSVKNNTRRMYNSKSYKHLNQPNTHIISREIKHNRVYQYSECDRVHPGILKHSKNTQSSFTSSGVSQRQVHFVVESSDLKQMNTKFQKDFISYQKSNLFEVYEQKFIQDLNKQ